MCVEALVFNAIEEDEAKQAKAMADRKEHVHDAIHGQKRIDDGQAEDLGNGIEFIINPDRNPWGRPPIHEEPSRGASEA